MTGTTQAASDPLGHEHVRRDKNTLRAYVNTPATAKIAIAGRHKHVHHVAFSFLPQKTPQHI